MATASEANVERLVVRFKRTIGERRSEKTIEDYCQTLRSFCKQTGKAGEWDRDDVLGYVNSLIKAKYAGATVTKYYHSVKSIFDALQMDFPISSGDLPRGRFSEKQNQPIVPASQVLRMIQWARESGNVAEKFYLMVSTVYGPRRVELTYLTEDSFFDSVMNIEPPEGVINIDTAKHGPKRTHVLPEKLVPYVESAIVAGFMPLAQSTLSVMYNKICQKMERVALKDEGWHSIRRSLVTGLVNSNQVAPGLIRDYMRWTKPRNSRDMLDRYYQPDPEVVDRAVFEAHPYLGAWG